MHRDAKAGGGDSAAAVRRVERAVAALPAGRYLLAVSGGRDSMVLMDAAARLRTDVAAVATFDHATGAAAREAVRRVQTEAERLGLAAVSGARPPGRVNTEAAWREDRREFLAGWARELGATVVTGHTRDDQLETVVLRLLRDSRLPGARGLAAMYAPSSVARPLLGVARADIAAYSLARAVPHVDDPSNISRAHLRNRVRLDILPALEAAAPGFGAEILDIARRAAHVRDAVDELVDGLGLIRSADGKNGDYYRAVAVPAESLTPMSAESLQVVWPAIAARAGVTLDRRGLERLLTFTRQGKVGGVVPLSGGGEVERTGATFVVRAPRRSNPTILNA